MKMNFKEFSSTTMSTFKPMLAANYDGEINALFDGRSFLASIKFDGVRALSTSQGIIGRSLKPIPNLYAQELFKDVPVGVEGELILAKLNRDLEPYEVAPVNVTTSFVMSKNAEIVEGTAYEEYHLIFMAFDYFANAELTAHLRFQVLTTKLHLCQAFWHNHVMLVNQVEVNTYDQYLEFCNQHTDQTVEGYILKLKDGKYKHGRSTAKQALMIRDVKFARDEGILVALEQRKLNLNESKPNELGYLAKSKTVDAVELLDEVGALVLEHPKFGQFKVGTGFDRVTAAQWWANRANLIGSMVTFQYKPFGVLDKPRQPVFVAFRSEVDM